MRNPYWTKTEPKRSKTAEGLARKSIAYEMSSSAKVRETFSNKIPLKQQSGP